MELNIVNKVDSEVASLIKQELERQQNTIELIASENYGSSGKCFNKQICRR